MATVQVKENGEEENVANLGKKGGLADIIEPVCIPREPCTNWLTSMAGKVVSEVACGGQHTMAIAVGEVRLDGFLDKRGGARRHPNLPTNATPFAPRFARCTPRRRG